MHPIKATKEFKEPFGIKGTKIPSKMEITSGLIHTKFVKKHATIIIIKNENNYFDKFFTSILLKL